MSARLLPRLLGVFFVATSASAQNTIPGQMVPTIQTATGGYYAPSNNYNNANAGTQACGLGTLSSYRNLGFNGCTIGAVTFYNFRFDNMYGFNSGPVTSFQSGNDIAIAPDASGNPSLRFTDVAGDWIRSADQGPVTYHIEYYIDPPIDILGYDLVDDPFGGAGSTTTYVNASICQNTEFDQYGYQCVNGANTNLNLNGTNFTQGIGTVFPAGTKFLDVQLTIHVEPGASIPGFAGDARAAAIKAIPEPEILALEIIGGFAVVGAAAARLRRRRNDAA